MSYRDHRVECVKRSNTTFEESTLDDLKCLIRDLSLKERAFELIHPDKSRAIEKIMLLGKAAVEPLIEAFDTSNLEGRGWIIYLLGELVDNGEIAPIVEYLTVNKGKMSNDEGNPLNMLNSRTLGRLLHAAQKSETRSAFEF